MYILLRSLTPVDISVASSTWDYFLHFDYANIVIWLPPKVVCTRVAKLGQGCDLIVTNQPGVHTCAKCFFGRQPGDNSST